MDKCRDLLSVSALGVKQNWSRTSGSINSCVARCLRLGEDQSSLQPTSTAATTAVSEQANTVFVHKLQ